VIQGFKNSVDRSVSVVMSMVWLMRGVEDSSKLSNRVSPHPWLSL